MENKLNIAVIGLGIMGARHADVCSSHPNLNLVAVCDVREDLVKRFSEKLNVSGYKDFVDMFNMEKLDAVVVACSDQYHRQPCEEAAKRGIQIFLEKPIATTSIDAKAIIDCAKANKIKLMVGHTLRYDPRYLAVYEKVISGEMGRINHFYARRNATVKSGRRIEGRAEVVVFQGVHDLDFINWIMKSKIIRVYAEGNHIELKDLNVADTILATLRFENGAIGILEQSWGLPVNLPSPLDAQLEVVGSKGAAYLELRAQSVSIFTDGTYSQPDNLTMLPRAHYLVDEYDQFIGYLQGIKEPLASGEEALEALIVAEAIVESMKKGVPVNL